MNEDRTTQQNRGHKAHPYLSSSSGSSWSNSSEQVCCKCLRKRVMKTRHSDATNCQWKERTSTCNEQTTKNPRDFVPRTGLSYCPAFHSYSCIQGDTCLGALLFRRFNALLALPLVTPCLYRSAALSCSHPTTKTSTFEVQYKIVHDDVPAHPDATHRSVPSKAWIAWIVPILSSVTRISSRSLSLEQWKSSLISTEINARFLSQFPSFED